MESSISTSAHIVVQICDDKKTMGLTKTKTTTYMLSKIIDDNLVIPLGYVDADDLQIKSILVQLVIADSTEQDDFIEELSTLNFGSIETDYNGALHSYAYTGYAVFEYQAEPCKLVVVD